VLLFFIRELFQNEIVTIVITIFLVAWTLFISLSNSPFKFNSPVFIFLNVLLWIFTIIMFRIIAKTSKDTMEKALYFLKLKFTRLTLILSLEFIANILFILIMVVVILFQGEISWEVSLLIPFSHFILLFIQIMVIFLGLINWEGFKNICFLPIKMFFRNKKQKLESNL
jgi:hypothetical protein